MSEDRTTLPQFVWVRDVRGHLCTYDLDGKVYCEKPAVVSQAVRHGNRTVYAFNGSARCEAHKGAKYRA